MSQNDPVRAYALVRCVGGPLDGRVFADMPVYEHGPAAKASIPVGDEQRADYLRRAVTEADGSWTYDYLGPEGAVSMLPPGTSIVRPSSWTANRRHGRDAPKDAFDAAVAGLRCQSSPEAGNPHQPKAGAQAASPAQQRTDPSPTSQPKAGPRFVGAGGLDKEALLELERRRRANGRRRAYLERTVQNNRELALLADSARAAEQIRLAQRIAVEAHAGQSDATGDDLVRFLERVASRFDPVEQPVEHAVAWLHEVVPSSWFEWEDLKRRGVDRAVIGLAELLDPSRYEKPEQMSEHLRRSRRGAAVMNAVIAELSDLTDDDLRPDARRRIEERKRLWTGEPSTTGPGRRTS